MENKNTIQDKCPLCHNKDIYDLRKRFEYTLSVCRGCDFMFVKEDFNYSDYYNRYYFDNYDNPEAFCSNIKNDGTEVSYADNRNEHKKVYTNILLLLNRFKKLKNSNLLDVGCAEGYGLLVAKDMGSNVFGVDVSVDAINRCKEKKIRDVYSGELSELPVRNIDVVIMNDVLEHMRDPNKNLQALNKIMNESGVVFVKNNLFSLNSFKNDQNYFERQFEPPYHCSYFSKKRMIEVFNKHGFKLVYQKPKFVYYMFELYSFMKRLLSKKQRQMHCNNKKTRLSKKERNIYSTGSFLGRFVNEFFPSGFVFKKVRNI
ncbi:TPA: hypothetical protein DCZ46_00405 [Candidatus Campbellbacteria bacterium]|nr:MAG: methyltransferase family protein [Candidatus Campbellbacteria bacterium GW2011_OD1_34_28]KKP75449.1 MAG: Methyltransferase family protein [Candidatus Campbellbacteria bacterium GW2011_GWD2_35_24]KKP75990.1 MAG: methyltransferase family protein [Candidatus Campbellbacteria bacterium GW2011_GWC2_35_28]KKP77179.1 MAG: Methyltransferase family protein [Candidatus Campbellbacteria bacterium GW2011_GWC1_35_31]KKP79108.1 MAG: Methyltransferase family protein [Candidatus Campbellbacteria bacter